MRNRTCIAALVLTILAGAVACLDEPTEVTITVGSEAELLAALSSAEGGELIELESGTYGEIGNYTTDGGTKWFIRYPNSWPSNVWVRPAPGATVSLGWRSMTPNLTLAGAASTDEVDDRTLVASIVFLETAADRNEILAVDRINQAHVASADDTVIAWNRIYDPSFGADDGLQIKQRTPGDYPTNTHVVGNTIGPIWRQSSGHHGDCVQTLKARDTFIWGNTLLPCSNAGLQFDGLDEGVTDVDGNTLYGCNPIVPLPGPEACDSSGSVKGGSRPQMSFTNNVFHSGGFSLNVEGPGDEFFAEGNTFDSEAWPGL